MKYSVSVIIPIREKPNLEDYEFLFEELKNSENVNNYEIIFVIDQDDDFVEVYENYIFVCKNKQSNPGELRNIGSLFSKCEFLAFLDSDDKWREEKIDAQFQKMEQKKTNACITNSVEYRDNKKIINPEMSEERFYKAKLNGLTSSILVEKNLFDSVDGFDKFYRRYEDQKFLHKLIKCNQLSMIKDPYIYIMDRNFSNTKTVFQVIKYRGTLILYNKEFWNPHYILDFLGDIAYTLKIRLQKLFRFCRILRRY